MKFSLVIPTVKQITMLFECIESFMRHHGRDHEIIIVDDGSDQGTQHIIKSRGEALGCKVILNEKNSGFPTTVNKGIRASSGDIVIAVNNDILFTRPILKYIEQDFNRDEKIGIVGALLFYPNGLIQHGGIFKHGRAFGHRGLRKRYEQAPECQTGKYLIGVTGALFAMRRSCLDQVGMFKEEFFLAAEDTELCLRTWNNNWRVFYDPRIQAIHKEGETRGNDHASKVIKGKDWYKKEMQTEAKFQGILQVMEQKGEVIQIERKVNEANLNNLHHHISDDPYIDDPNIEIEPIVKEEVKELRSQHLHETTNHKASIIGVNRAGAFGDVLMATPIIREIKRRHPNSEIWVSTHCPDAVVRNKNVSRVLKHKNELMQFTDVIYDLDMVYENNPKKLTVDAYSEAAFGSLLEDKSIDLHSDNTDFQGLFPHIAGTISFERDKVIVVHMGVGWENRTWPRPNWISVVRGLSTRGYKVVVVGKGSDYKSDLLAGVLNLNDKLTIPQIRELIKRSSVFCGMDSGILHVAQSTNTPIVSLFTVANPEYRMVRKNKVINLIPKSDCKFCLHEMPPPVTFVSCRFGHKNCLKEITPQEVLQAIGQAVNMR